MNRRGFLGSTLAGILAPLVMGVDRLLGMITKLFASAPLVDPGVRSVPLIYAPYVPLYVSRPIYVSPGVYHDWKINLQDLKDVTPDMAAAIIPAKSCTPVDVTATFGEVRPVSPTLRRTYKSFLQSHPSTRYYKIKAAPPKPRRSRRRGRRA